MRDELTLRLERIFEAGIFYNTAIETYEDQIKFIDGLDEIISRCPYEAHYFLRRMISKYHVEKEPRNSNKILNLIASTFNDMELVTAVKKLKSDLNLTWDYEFFNKKIREQLAPKKLLTAYINVREIINRSPNINEKNIENAIGDLSILEKMRDDNIFFRNSVTIYRGSEIGSIHIFYDKGKVSFRQALLLAFKKTSKRDGLDILQEKNFSININTCFNILVFLSFMEEKRARSISQEAYFEEIYQELVAKTSLEINDKRTIYRGGKKFDELKKIIKSVYEVSVEEQENEEKKFANKNLLDIDNRVNAFIAFQSALSAYIRYYSFILSNVDFFLALETFQKSISNDHSLSCNHSWLLNNINQPLNKLSKNTFDKELIYINFKYDSDLKNLMNYGVQSEYWGYFFNYEIIPHPKEIITIISKINDLCCGDYSSITHEYLDSLNITRKIKNSILINTIIPSKTMTVSAGYGKSDHAIVTPMGDKDDIPGNINSALRLYDMNAKLDYLKSTIEITKINKMEEIIWGLFHYYEEAFSKDKRNKSTSINIIDSLYKEPIIDNRFLSGKRAARQKIRSIKEQ
ncbi:hypothetical protein [Aeromonas enteropelogenes]|uniref:hypothetical protein n=1 Tax=Aeromonas enteropelogenes TaxID=29489 RepID=UPI003B9FA1C1